jgi:hypothetical protein
MVGIAQNVNCMITCKRPIAGLFHNKTLSNMAVRGPQEGWTELSTQLRDRIRTRFNLEELEAVNRFILLASRGSVFDDVRLQPRLAKAV